MAKAPYCETNLVGNPENNISSVDTTIYVRFRDNVTGEARTPLATTKMFVLDKGSVTSPNQNYEIIICTSHSTTNGVTTLTGCTRGLGFSGNVLTAVSGNAKAHTTNSDVGCVDVHFLTTITNAKINGEAEIDNSITISTGFKLQLGTSAVYVYSDDGTTLKFKDDSNAATTLSTLAAAAGTDHKVLADDTDPTAGYLADKVDAGLSVNVTTHKLEVDTSSSDIFVTTTAGAADEGKVAILNDAGLINQENIEILKDVTATAAELNKLDNAAATVTAANLGTLTAGVASNADALHTHSANSLNLVRVTASDNLKTSDDAAAQRSGTLSSGVIKSLRVGRIGVYRVSWNQRTYNSTFGD